MSGFTHWGLAHFLLDGHHKTQAAAQAAGPVRLLTLLAIDYSLASRDDILAVPPSWPGRYRQNKPMTGQPYPAQTGNESGDNHGRYPGSGVRFPI